VVGHVVINQIRGFICSSLAAHPYLAGAKPGALLFPPTLTDAPLRWTKGTLMKSPRFNHGIFTKIEQSIQHAFGSNPSHIIVIDV